MIKATSNFDTFDFSVYIYNNNILYYFMCTLATVYIV